MNLTRIVFLSSLVLSGVSLGRTTTQVQVFASPSVVYETQVFDLKAQVFGAAPTGSVTFLSAGGVVLGQGNVAFNVATGLYEAVLSGVLPDGFGGTSIIEGVRKATITGDYSGDAANAPSSGSYFLTLKPRVATTSSVVANPSTAAVGQEVTIVTTVSGFVDGLGIVRLYDDGRFLELGSTGFPTRGICSIKVRFTTAGVHLIGSAYSLSKTDLPSFASGIDVTVVPGSSATALTLAPTSAYQNNAVTLTAVVSGSGPTGTVTFRDGPTVLGTANIVSGKATLSPTFTSTGSHSISASYSGDTNNQASASATATLVINAKLSTTTVLTSNAATVYAGQAVTFTSTVTGASPTGSATFKSGATTLSTVSLTAGKASLAWKFAAASAPVIQAVYSGDTNNASSNSSPVTVTVAPQVVPMLTLTPSVASAELYQPVTLTAQLSGTWCWRRAPATSLRPSPTTRSAEPFAEPTH